MPRKRGLGLKNALLAVFILASLIFITIPYVEAKTPIYLEIYAPYGGQTPSYYSESMTQQYTAQRLRVGSTYLRVRVHNLDGSDQYFSSARVFPELSLSPIRAYADRIMWIEVAMPIEYNGALKGYTAPLGYYDPFILMSGAGEVYFFGMTDYRIGPVQFSTIKITTSDIAQTYELAFYLSGNQGVDATIQDLKSRGLWRETWVPANDLSRPSFLFEGRYVSPTIIDIQSYLNQIKLGGMEDIKFTVIGTETWKSYWTAVTWALGGSTEVYVPVGETTVAVSKAFTVEGLRSGLTTTIRHTGTQTAYWTTDDRGRPVLIVEKPGITETITETTIIGESTTITVPQTTVVDSATTVTVPIPDPTPPGPTPDWSSLLDKLWKWLKGTLFGIPVWLILIGVLIILYLIYRLGGRGGGGGTVIIAR